MTDQSQDNHWDELVTDLGVEPRADAVQQPAADVPESKPATPPEFDAVPSQTSMSQTSAPGWDDLASDFGISPAPVQPRKAEPELAPVEAEAEIPLAEPQPAATDERRESAPTSRSADRREQPSPSDRPGRRRERSAEDSSVTQPEDFFVDVEHIEAVVDFEIAEEPEFSEEMVDVEEVAAKSEEADEKSERPRRRRRRRGRRGARRPEDGETEQSGDDSAAERPSDQKSDDDEDDLDDSDRVSGRSSGGKKTAHRNIPTWEEAVGVVVAANTEARAKAARNAGRSRGRGRGGRGRGRPARRESNDQK